MKKKIQLNIIGVNKFKNMAKCESDRCPFGFRLGIYVSSVTFTTYMVFNPTLRLHYDPSLRLRTFSPVGKVRMGVVFFLLYKSARKVQPNFPRERPLMDGLLLAGMGVQICGSHPRNFE